MLDCDLLEVLLPVSIKPDLLLSVTVKLGHYSANTCLETLLKLHVTVITGLYYVLVIRSVLNG